jgi:predicted RNA binding protein YcfA (HicA-like mRNA interferase family)
VSHCPSVKAKHLRRALLKIGWTLKRTTTSSHEILQRPGFADFTFAFHDSEEIGPRMLARVAKVTGLTPGDL